MSETSPTASDLIQRFLFDNTAVRGELVQLETSYQEALQKHNYPETIQQLLGEFMAAAALLTATIKIEGLLSLEARGQGQVSLLMAECNTGVPGNTQLRALANFNSTPEHKELNKLLENGQLIITLDPKDGTRYQGIVELKHANLSACLEDYFEQSEQLPTRLWLAADSQRAGGLLMQQLPDDQHNQDPDAWVRLNHLASTLTNEELLYLEQHAFLYRLFHEENLRVFEPHKLTFGCSCSRERTAKALTTLGADELKAALSEQGKITTQCHFCNSSYTYGPEDVDQLILETQNQSTPDFKLH